MMEHRVHFLLTSPKSAPHSLVRSFEIHGQQQIHKSPVTFTVSQLLLFAVASLLALCRR